MELKDHTWDQQQMTTFALDPTSDVLLPQLFTERLGNKIKVKALEQTNSLA